MKRSYNDRKIKGKLEVEELEAVEKAILKEIQTESFTGDEKSNLRTIHDKDGLLRVETRIASRKDLRHFQISNSIAKQTPAS